MQADPLRVLVVDDEPLARARLVNLLREDRSVVCCGECDSGRSAVAAIERMRPDVVLLDVSMPDMDGFSVIEAIGVERAPAILFVTAHEEFAVRAFEAHALDYLLKPFRNERFHAALARARAMIHDALAASRLRSLLDARATDRERRTLAVRTGTSYRIVDVADIEWLEAADNYVKLHLADSAPLLRATLSEMETSLDPRWFLRVHRRVLVNVRHVVRVRRRLDRGYDLVLPRGTIIRGSRTHEAAIRRMLSNHCGEAATSGGEPARSVL